MCPPIVGLILPILGSIASAVVGIGIANQQAKIEQEQLKVEIANERIKGLADTNDRLRAFRIDEAQNRAALSATGVDLNLSYTQGIAPANERVVKRDVARIQFNTGQEIGRKKYEIAVAGWRSRSTAFSTIAQTGADIAGSVGSYMVRSSTGSSSNPTYTSS